MWKRRRLRSNRNANRGHGELVAGVPEFAEPVLLVGFRSRDQFVTGSGDFETRCAHRLPLSTVDTYAGCSTASVEVSYQFKK